MKAKFYGEAESAERLPRVASIPESALLLRYLALKEQAKAIALELDNIALSLPYQDVMFAPVFENEGEGPVYTTFFVDKPEYISCKVREREVTSKPTTQADLKTLGLK